MTSRGASLSVEPVSPNRLGAYLHVLCEEIGVRLAGSSGEARAADYCGRIFAEAGAGVAWEPFAVKSRVVTGQRLEVRLGEGWAPFPCSLFSSTPGTDGQWVQAPLVFFEAPTEVRRPDYAHLRGKAVVHLGCHIESRDAYRRLMAARPAFLLLVDVRYPGSVPLADGMFPAYTRALGAVPTLNVAYQDAWRWRVEGAGEARIAVAGGMRDAESQNVIAELPGTDPDAEIVYLGAHHDTQADSVGADDNGTGTAGLLELARVLAPIPRRRTIRLVCFGAEEQLSAGSAFHVRARREEVGARAGVIFNLDSIGSWLGWNDLVLNGPAALEAYLRPFLEQRDLYARVVREIMPYADHFPFVAAGIPGVTLIRSNCTAGRFFHHRPDDDLSRVSVDVVAPLLDAFAALVADLASRRRMPFARAVPARQARAAAPFWEDLFGGWTGPAPAAPETSPPCDA